MIALDFYYDPWYRLIVVSGVQVCSSFKDAVSYLEDWLEEMVNQNQKNFG